MDLTQINRKLTRQLDGRSCSYDFVKEFASDAQDHSTNIRDVRTIAVESWLRQLHHKNGEALANSSEAKIRNLMSVLFNHAIRY